MRIALGILLMIGLAILATSPKFLKLRRATVVGILVSGGWLGVLVGLAIGPAGLALVSHDLAPTGTPILTIGLGWIGLMVGLQLRPEVLRFVPANLARRTAIDASISFTLAGAIAWLALSNAPIAPANSVIPLAALIGAATIGWPAETRSLRLTAAESGLAMALRASSGLSAPIAITLFAIAHALAGISEPPINGPDWAALLRIGGMALIAVTLGVVARFALRRAGDRRADLLAVFLGVVAIITGAAVELRVSPLFAAMLAGVVVTNLAGRELRRFERFILQAEHVVAVIFAIVAGVLMDVALGPATLGLLAAITIFRIIVKPTLAPDSLSPDSPTQRSRKIARLGAVRQPPLALVLGVGLVLTDPSPVNQQALTVLAAAGLFCDLYAVLRARAVKIETPEEPVENDSAPSTEEGASP